MCCGAEPQLKGKDVGGRDSGARPPPRSGRRREKQAEFSPLFADRDCLSAH
jgi:hypothetical protein